MEAVNLPKVASPPKKSRMRAMQRPMQNPLRKRIGGEDCMCSICTCGLHHCPRCNPGGPAHAGKFNGASETHEAFPDYAPQERTKSHKPTGMHQSAAPFEGVSEFKAAYPGHNAAVRQRGQRLAPWKGQGTFTDETSSRADFVPHALLPEERVNLFRGQQSVGPAGPLDPKQPLGGTTTNQDMYPVHKLGPKRHAEPELYVGNGGKFEGRTSNQDDFVPHALLPEERVNLFRGQQSVGPAGPLDPKQPLGGTTTNRDMYPGYQTEPKPKAGRSMMGPYVGNGGTFQGRTSNNDDFVPHALLPEDRVNLFRGQQSIGPAGPLDPKQPLGGTTTNQDMYPGHQPEQRRRHGETGPYTGNRGKFEGRTSNQDDFMPHALLPEERVNLFRGQQSVGPAGPLDPAQSLGGTTINQDMFKSHAVGPRPRRGHKETGPYVGNGGTFQGRTSNQDDFVPHALLPEERVNLFRGQQSVGPAGPLDPKQPLGGTTTNRELYPGHQPAPKLRRGHAETGPYIGNGGKFQGRSSTKDDFVPHALLPEERVNLFRGQQGPPLDPKKGASDWSTTNKELYVARSQSPCPVPGLPAGEMNPRTGHMHYRHEGGKTYVPLPSTGPP